MNTFSILRQHMIDDQLKARGLHDQSVLNAIAAVPREEFVATDLVEFAYSDSPLPIEADQTISQPYIVALMTAALELEPEDRVLEVGTGSGYAAAILGEIAKEVFSIERHKILVDSARKRLEELGYRNIQILYGDGTLGWPEHAPFDRIIVTAAPDHVPQPLIDQLRPGGRMVLPVGEVWRVQELTLVVKHEDGRVEQTEVMPVGFVPLTRD
jgi:protein-L-isoaspartate(D-aspartate) O-methyltransferase